MRTRAVHIFLATMRRPQGGLHHVQRSVAHISHPGPLHEVGFH